MKRRVAFVTSLTLVGSFVLAAPPLRADDDKRKDSPRNGCNDLPSQSALRDALRAAQDQANGGFGLATGSSVPSRSPGISAATSGPVAV
jgi:hypothetical protein